MCVMSYRQRQELQSKRQRNHHSNSNNKKKLGETFLPAAANSQPPPTTTFVLPTTTVFLVSAAKRKRKRSKIDGWLQHLIQRAKTAAVSVAIDLTESTVAEKDDSIPAKSYNAQKQQQLPLLSSLSTTTTTTTSNHNYSNCTTTTTSDNSTPRITDVHSNGNNGNNDNNDDCTSSRHGTEVTCPNNKNSNAKNSSDNISSNRQAPPPSSDGDAKRPPYFIGAPSSANDCNVKLRSLHDVEELRTDNDEDEAAVAAEDDERGGFFFRGGSSKRRKYFFLTGKSYDRAFKPRVRPLPRLVAKNGECLIRPKNLPNKLLNTYRNWFHLLIEISWRNVLLIFATGFLGSWLFFGLIYYLITQYYDYTDEVRRYESHQCIANVHSFVSAFLFSLESQHTIGYGVRYMTEMCPPAYFVLCVQLIVGVLAQTLLAGIVIAKILRPKKRKQEMRFSRSAAVAWPMEEEDEIVTNTAPFGLSHSGQVADQLSIASLASMARRGSCTSAVMRQNSVASKARFSVQTAATNARTSNCQPVDAISQGSSSTSCAAHKPVLMIRLADVQHKLYLAESHVRLYMAITKINSKGEKELIGIRDMNVGYDNGTDRVLLLWPVLIRHIIDEDSPFYGMTPEKARTSTDFELIMTVEGIVEATGMTFQARTSFLPNEIKWGQRFVPIVLMNPKTNKFEVDYSLFDVTKPSALPPEMMGGDGSPAPKHSIITNPPANLFSTTIDEMSTNILPQERNSIIKHAPISQKNENTRTKISSQNDVRRSIDSAAVNRNNSIIPAIDSECDEEHNVQHNPTKSDENDELEEEYCKGGDANLDGSDTNDYDGGDKPLLLMHAHPHTHCPGGHHGTHHGSVYHHHFHQRHRHHSSSGFT